MIGETVLHYEIIEKLGEGGMGVVYKAEDTKLEREVAVKLLPRRIAPNAEERKRFKIEAKAAAALNHPNIATIHAIEEVDDELFIVMEYIEGKELKEIVGTQDVMPLPDVLNYATQIAKGLQAAHKKGITHRDIKSGNIMITEDGQVKIMDFGLGADGHVLLSRIYFSEDNLMEALEHVEQAIRLDSDYSDAYWLHGLILLKQGDTRTARSKLAKLRQPLVNKHGLEDKWLVYHLKAQILLAEERFKEALEHLYRALELFPPDRSFYLTALGDAYVRSNQPAKAMASYREALEFNPNNARALFGLNQVLEK